MVCLKHQHGDDIYPEIWIIQKENGWCDSTEILLDSDELKDLARQIKEAGF